MKEENFLLLTDAYKITHHKQYPPDTKVVYSYLEPRVGAEYEDIVWCGIQAVLKHYRFDKPVVTRSNIDEAYEFCMKVFGHADFFNKEGWEYIREKHGGMLPIAITALPEGTIVKPGTPVLAVYNTDEKVPWLTNYVESILMHAYSMTNSATISYNCYKTIKKWCDIAGESVSPFHLNDFGLRGASSLMSAEFCGIGHLLVFLGTDNLPAINLAMDYYESDVCGYSVIAAEHSTITAWGIAYELDAYKNILNTSPSNATVSLVIDSYNWVTTVKTMFCKDLKKLILDREGKTVLRPDSGIPHLVTRDILEMLWESYGGTTNAAGYKILDPHLGIIYGDGINADGIDMILKEAMNAGFAPSNVIFGMGGNLLQNHNRDTLRFALKCSSVKRDDVWRDVQKITPGKMSKAGRFNLPMVYCNGVMKRHETLSEIRKRIGVLNG